METIGAWRQDSWPSISYTDYANGYTLYGFRIEPESNCDYANPPMTGNISIEVKFKTSHDFSINAVMFAEFQSSIFINETRQVTTDYQ